jgi:hypothetical protein
MRPNPSDPDRTVSVAIVATQRLILPGRCSGFLDQLGDLLMVRVIPLPVPIPVDRIVDLLVIPIAKRVARTWRDDAADAAAAAGSDAARGILAWLAKAFKKAGDDEEAQRYAVEQARAELATASINAVTLERSLADWALSGSDTHTQRERRLDALFRLMPFPAAIKRADARPRTGDPFITSVEPVSPQVAPRRAEPDHSKESVRPQ